MKWNNEPSYSRKTNNKNDNINKQKNNMPNGRKNGEAKNVVHFSNITNLYRLKPQKQCKCTPKKLMLSLG